MVYRCELLYCIELYESFFIIKHLILFIYFINTLQSYLYIIIFIYMILNNSNFIYILFELYYFDCTFMYILICVYICI